jgi:hypothetical protein
MGEDADRLEAHLHLLPPNRTTVYAIARTDTDEFKRLVESGTLGPKMTRAQMDGCLNRAKSRDAVIKRDAVIDVGDMDDTKARDLCGKLKVLEQEFGFRMKLSNNLAQVSAT